MIQVANERSCKCVKKKSRLPSAIKGDKYASVNKLAKSPSTAQKKPKFLDLNFSARPAAKPQKRPIKTRESMPWRRRNHVSTAPIMHPPIANTAGSTNAIGLCPPPLVVSFFSFIFYLLLLAITIIPLGIAASGSNLSFFFPQQSTLSLPQNSPPSIHHRSSPPLAAGGNLLIFSNCPTLLNNYSRRNFSSNNWRSQRWTPIFGRRRQSFDLFKFPGITADTHLWPPEAITIRRKT